MMNFLSTVLAMVVISTAPNATVDRIESNYAVVEMAYPDEEIVMVDVDVNKFNNDISAGEKITTKSVVGCFTSYDYYYGGSQFKSYDDEIWWLLKFDELGFVPQLNVPYIITYCENDTSNCNCDYCDNCWREDDIFLSIKNID